MSKRAKRANRPNPRTDRNNPIIEISKYQRKKKVEFIPRNLNQDEFLDHLENSGVHICFGIGPAGSGKTLAATLIGIKMFKEGYVDKIVISRPNIAVDDKDIGFLPGGIYQKMAPWCRPIIDIFEEYYSPREIELLIEEGLLEICPLAFIRGRTFKNSWIIIDEAQNTTMNSMFSILTRLGERSKMVVTGDIDQSDRGKNNGLQDFLDRYTDSDMIRVVKFNDNDVERHEVVSEVIKMYRD